MYTYWHKVFRLIDFDLPYCSTMGRERLTEREREIHRLRVSFNRDIGPFRNLSTYTPSMNDKFELLLTLRNLYTTMRSMMGACRSQERPPKSGRVPEG